MAPVPDTTSALHQPQPQMQTQPRSTAELPDAAIDFATRMFDLARRGDASLLNYLAAGLPPNLTNNRGDTLLMLASYHGHADLVRRMLEEAEQAGTRAASQQDAPASQVRGWRGKPDPNQLNGRGQSIVAGAVFKGYDQVVRVLIDHGADPLAGQPNAEECAHMFNKWEGEHGFQQLFQNAPGRGAGGREAAPVVEDREEQRRVPGVGLQQVSSETDPYRQQQQPPNDGDHHHGVER